MKKLLIIILLTIFLSCNPPLKLDKGYYEVPQFNQFKGEILWELELKADQNATGADFQDGMLFVGTTQKWIFAYEAATGERLDKMWADVPIEMPPTVDDSLLYYSGAGEWNVMGAINIFTGDELWNKTARTVGSKIISGDSTVYFASKAGGINRVRKSDGKILNQRRLEQGISCELLLNGDRLFIGARGKRIVVLDANDLSLIENINIESPVAENFLQLGDRIYANLESGKLIIIDRKELEIIKTINLDGEYTTAPILIKNLIFTVNNAGLVTCYTNKEPYEKVWQKKLKELPPADFDFDAGYDRSGEASVFANPAMINGKLFIITYRGSMYLIDPQTSHIDLQKKIKGRYRKAPMSYSSLIFLFSENSHIIALK